jgi:hypothetical protein
VGYTFGMTQMKIYRVGVNLDTATGTVKTSRSNLTQAGVDKLKSDLRAKAPRGSVLTFSVREI